VIQWPPYWLIVTVIPPRTSTCVTNHTLCSLIKYGSLTLVRSLSMFWWRLVVLPMSCSTMFQFYDSRWFGIHSGWRHIIVFSWSCWIVPSEVNLLRLWKWLIVLHTLITIVKLYSIIVVAEWTSTPFLGVGSLSIYVTMDFWQSPSSYAKVRRERKLVKQLIWLVKILQRVRYKGMYYLYSQILAYI